MQLLLPSVLTPHKLTLGCKDSTTTFKTVFFFLCNILLFFIAFISSSFITYCSSNQYYLNYNFSVVQCTYLSNQLNSNLLFTFKESLRSLTFTMMQSYRVRRNTKHFWGEPCLCIFCLNLSIVWYFRFRGSYCTVVISPLGSIKCFGLSIVVIALNPAL